jgi:hypothetical protein
VTDIPGSRGEGFGSVNVTRDFGGVMRDFGGMESAEPREVVRPSSTRDVVEALARRDGHTPVVPRGCGHSTDGRSLTSGISIDMRSLAAVRDVRGDRVDVDAGATWREVLVATLPQGAAPAVLTDYLDLTVGGTLSAGGVGGTSHVHGTQARAGNVLELEVATSDGGQVPCSPARNRWLFDAVRGGGGRHGVITRAVIGLVPVPGHVLSCTVPCEDAAGLLRVQDETRADHLSGQAVPSETGGWEYEAKAVLFGADAPPPDLESSEVEELTFWEFADRMRPDVEELIEIGEWARPHPWAMAFLPGAGAAGFIEGILAAMGRDDVGLSGFALIKALKGGGDPGVPGLAGVPDPVLFALLRTASPGCAPAATMDAANAEILARAQALGGLRYPL